MDHGSAVGGVQRSSPFAAPSAIRYALAREAYRTGTVRLVDPDLSGCDRLVATRGGMFAIGPGKVRLVAHGLYFGLCVHDDTIFAFEAGDRPAAETYRGRIVRFRRVGARIVSAEVFATDLDNGCHQIDLIDGALCVVDTYNQRIVRLPLDGGARDTLQPLGSAARNDWAGGYVHVNALLASGPDILLLLHNGAGKTGRASEVLRLDRAWQVVSRETLAGSGCHDLALLEDGTLLSCGSSDGELVTSDRARLKVCDLMTRGLSVDAHTIAVGGTAFAARDLRDEAAGRVFLLDRAGRHLETFELDGPPTEICRIDGLDRSLSPYLASLPSPPALRLHPALTNRKAEDSAIGSSWSSGP
ncbi:hypothetical protein [Sphingomonas sp. PAMC 26605]|uniref:hypothetical protein n=1 Tax=Sphingomonas sp. PAMC 26605 TaxID=1112214 RepID=UPI00026CDD40|nr:hypothetical protein [Sphingomonas sp. PAMC 26605]